MRGVYREAVRQTLREEGGRGGEQTRGRALSWRDLQVGTELEVKWAQDQQWYPCEIRKVKPAAIVVYYSKTQDWDSWEETLERSEITAERVRLAQGGGAGPSGAAQLGSGRRREDTLAMSARLRPSGITVRCPPPAGPP